MRDELVKVLSPDEAIQVVDEVESLLVRDGAERVVGVGTFKVDDELGELVISAEECYRVLYGNPLSEKGG